MDNIEESVAHTIQVSKNQKMLFLLNPITGREGIFEFQKGADKIIRIERDNNKEGYNFCSDEPIKSWRQFREHIELLCGNNIGMIPFNFTSKELKEGEICFLLTNPEISL